MKELIRQAIVKEYKTLGYGTKAINVVLEYLEKSIKEESEIDEAVKGVGPMLKIFQSEINRVAAAEVAKEKERLEAEKEESAQEKTGGVDSESTKKTTKDSEGVPEWAKGLIESSKAQVEANKALADRLAAFESGKTTESRKQTLESKLKDAPEVFKTRVLKDFGRIKFENDDAYNEYLSEIEADALDAAQVLTNQGLGGTQRPYVPAGGSGAKQASKEEAEALLKSILPN